MVFLSGRPPVTFKKPLFCSILANTKLSTIPGVSGAGPSSEETLLTPVLDAELISCGTITSHPGKPNTPSGCPTPASITRAMLKLLGMEPVFINAGLYHSPTVPCLDVYGEPGDDPRYYLAVNRAKTLFERGRFIGRFLSGCGDLLVLGECVPGGTTTALCVLRALGYDAAVSSSLVKNPVNKKEEICASVLRRIQTDRISEPLDIVRYTGDPMMAVAAGIAKTYSGEILLAGGTQMLAVAAIIKALGGQLPYVVTTIYVKRDASANIESLAKQIEVKMFFVDPEFENIGHDGLARYCTGEVKEGMGAGGAMCLANLTGYSPDVIRRTILSTVNAYTRTAL